MKNSSKKDESVDARLLEPLIDFLVIRDKPAPSDVIFIFGSRGLPAIWERAAQLYHEGFAPLILTTGHVGRMSKEDGMTEGYFLADRLVELGVPSSAIIVEEKSAHTAENVTFGIARLVETGHVVRTAILVAKPFHMRRCIATFQKQFPDVRVLSCPPEGSAENMLDRPFYEFAERLVGEIDRLIKYGVPGGTIAPQKIPPEIMEATKKLKNALEARR